MIEALVHSCTIVKPRAARVVRRSQSCILRSRRLAHTFVLWLGTSSSVP